MALHVKHCLGGGGILNCIFSSFLLQFQCFHLMLVHINNNFTVLNRLTIIILFVIVYN